MLMLVVTIIIAAVVSGFAGNLANANSGKAPSLAMDVKISNSGSWSGSEFSAVVTGTSEPISTKNLKLVTQWRSSSGTSGGNTSQAGVKNYFNGTDYDSYTVVAPFGIGAGVNSSYVQGSKGPSWSQNPTDPYKSSPQQFGNYTLTPGTTMYATPAGAADFRSIGNGIGGASGYGVSVDSTSDPVKYTYASSDDWWSTHNDAMQAVLGKGWESLKAGDTVSISVVHIPTGKTIFQKDVIVSEG